MPMSFHNQKLPNYLRTHRKRTGFSQDEIAFLLGTRTGAHVCRYERFTRRPTLATAFALEVIFHTPTKELFAGAYRQAERQVANRAKLLAKRATERPDSFSSAKLQALQTIAGIGAATLENR